MTCRTDGVIVGIVESTVRRVGLALRIWSGHVVRCLALNEASEDILCVGELVLIQRLVLNSISVEPDVGTLYKQTPAHEDRDLSRFCVIKIVIGRPEPVVLHIDVTRTLCDMYVGVSSHAGIVDTADRTLGDLQVGPFRATNTSVNIPKAGTLGEGHVDFHEFSSRCWTLCADQEIRKLDGAAVANFADLDNWNCVRFAPPSTTTGQDDRICFTDYFSSRRNIKCLRNFVMTMVQEKNLAAGCDRVDRILERSSIVRASIARSARSTSADEAANCKGLVLRLRFGVVFDTVQKTSWANRSDAALELCWTIWTIFVSLAPSLDSCRTACEHSAAWTLDGNRNVVKSNVFQNQLSSAGSG